APRSCHWAYVAHSPDSYPLLSAAAQRHTVLMPRYAFLLVALIGDAASLPDVCQGIFQLPTPCSIAWMIWDVTRAYTSGFWAEVFSSVDIEAPFSFGVQGPRRTAIRRGPVFMWRSIGLE